MRIIGGRASEYMRTIPFPFPFPSPLLSLPRGIRRVGFHRVCSKMDAEIGEFIEYIDRLKNYERIGVPENAGTDSDDGFDLGRMRCLLHRLGDPHLRFKAVHIAGTKGKGSTAAFLSNILREEGYNVGCYTSPHLLSIRERITLGHGQPVPGIMLKKLFHEVKGILDKSSELENGALTHFEVFTALAFSLFSQEKVDFAIIEAGLGGARDATNVLTSEGLAAAVITTIGEEHLAALGGSLESIAAAKAGIVKQGRPLVIGGPFEQHIEHILRQKASLMGSNVVSACDPGIQSFIRHFGKQNDIPYQSCDIFVDAIKDLPSSVQLSNVNLFMLGEHQLHNAVTATCTSLCLRSQGWSISNESIHSGLEKTRLPGRSQFLACHQVDALGLPGVSILIDGAHTEASAKSVVDVVRKACKHKALALVVAMASDKDHVAFLRQLLSGLQPGVVLLTEVSIAGSASRMTPASSLKDSCLHAASDLGVDVFDLGTTMPTEITQRNQPKKILTVIGCDTGPIVKTLKTANQLLDISSKDTDRLIVVTGSFHIVSSLLAMLH